MAYHLTTIAPNGDRTTQTQDAVPDLATLQAGVGGGLIQLIPHFNLYGAQPCVAFCDDEGKLTGQELNAVATYLWYACLAPEPFRPDTLAGSIIIVCADTEQELEAL